MECLLPYLCMVTVPHIMVGLERMLDYRGVGLAKFHCMYVCAYIPTRMSALSMGRVFSLATAASSDMGLPLRGEREREHLPKLSHWVSTFRNGSPIYVCTCMQP